MGRFMITIVEQAEWNNATASRWHKQVYNYSDWYFRCRLYFFMQSLPRSIARKVHSADYEQVREKSDIFNSLYERLADRKSGS